MNTKVEVYEHKRSSRRRNFLIGFSVIFLLMAIGVFCAWWFLVVQNIAEEVAVEAGSQTVDADAFLIRDHGVSAAFVNDLTEIDLNEPGDYPVRLRYRGRIYDSVLRVQDTTNPAASVTEVVALSIEMPQPEDFILEIQDVTDVTVKYVKEPDMSLEGEQTVILLLTDESGNHTEVEAQLTVFFDKMPPVISGVEPLRIFLGNNVDYLSHVTIHDDLDEAPELLLDDSAVNLNRAGEYQLVYIGRDASGNEARETATLTIIEDNTAPTILGVNPISLYEGSTVAYRSGILVTDDLDEHPVLRVDSSGVNLSMPGIYEVIYIATDEAGNESRIATTVTVAEKTSRYVDEETIYAAVDAVLAKIVNDEMTVQEKVEAIYRWEKRSLTYSSTSDKTDWMQAAYIMLTRRSGDCFNYYAVAKLMFDRLGIPNITVLRSEDSARGSRHYWSLVSVDGGETYYHFDSTPRSASYGGNRDFCLVTDAVLDAYDRYYPGYYTRDLSLYPATPEE